MIDDQIEQIAEEFGEYMSDNVLYQRDYAADMKRMLEWLTKRYCVVESSKVIKERISILKRCRDQDHYDGALETLESLFGSEIINKI